MGATNARIMVVEDDSSLRDWIQFELGFDGYEVKQAADGALALQELRCCEPPDLILLDVQMPGMDGYQVSSELQRLPAYEAVPIIFLTARTELNDRLNGFAAGATDYLTKPFKMAELKARIHALLRQTVRNRSLGRREEHKRASEEMDEAAIIQRTLMTCSLGGVTNVEVVASCQPARMVGGDLYDVYERSDGRLNLVEADVSGKGLPAAMVTAEVRTMLRETARQVASPAAALALANHRLYDDLSEVSKFVTVFAAFYSPQQHTLTYANGGHSVITYSALGGAAQVLEPTGLPLGIFPDAQYDEVTLAFGVHDVLVVASDGFAEAHNEAYELFGYDRLLTAINAAAHLPARQIADHLMAAVMQFVQHCEQSDDQTLIVLKGIECSRE
jgi:serine phosphatase RsbU (regulator of sigma subunit)